MKFGKSCRRYTHNRAHAIWLGCLHFYCTLSRVTVFLWTQCSYMSVPDDIMKCIPCYKKSSKANMQCIVML